MKSDSDNVLGKGIEAIFQRTARFMKEHGKTLELPNGVIFREGEDLIIRLRIEESEDIRRVVEELNSMAQNGMLDQLMDRTKVKSKAAEHLEMAQMAIDENDLNAAVNELEQGLSLQESPTARYNLGRVFESRGQSDKAIQNYRLVIKTNPKDVEATCNLGRIYYDRGDFTRAMELFERAVKLRPKLADCTREGLFPGRFGYRKMTGAN
jgi:tetratricopeptide (TPR) repeat protein